MPSKPTTAVVDADKFKYACAFSGEKRSVLVEHPNGFSREFKNRTAFYGRDKKSEHLKILNKRRDSEFTFEEFTYTDIQRAEPLDSVLISTQNTIDREIRISGAKRAKFFVGSGESFRVERSTLLKYKGNRENLKPVYIDEVTQFIIDRYGAEVVTHYEADDRLVMECFRQPDNFIIGEDKDYLGCPVNFFNVNTPELGIQECNQFGKLFRKKNGDVTGIGRMFFYFQVMAGDNSDNYKANCFSDVRWGDISAYNLLKDCKDDKEAFLAMKQGYQTLYPQPKIVTGWRGKEIEIDWQYVFNENFDLARMVRFEGDVVVGSGVMDKLLGGI